MSTPPTHRVSQCGLGLAALRHCALVLRLPPTPAPPPTIGGAVISGVVTNGSRYWGPVHQWRRGHWRRHRWPWHATGARTCAARLTRACSALSATILVSCSASACANPSSCARCFWAIAAACARFWSASSAARCFLSVSASPPPPPARPIPPQPAPATATAHESFSAPPPRPLAERPLVHTRILWGGGAGLTHRRTRSSRSCAPPAAESRPGAARWRDHSAAAGGKPAPPLCWPSWQPAALWMQLRPPDKHIRRAFMRGNHISQCLVLQALACMAYLPPAAA